MGRLRVRLPAPRPPSKVEDDHRTSILDSPYSATLEGGGRGGATLDPRSDLRSSILASDLLSVLRSWIFVPVFDLRSSIRSSNFAQEHPKGPKRLHRPTPASIKFFFGGVVRSWPLARGSRAISRASSPSCSPPSAQCHIFGVAQQGRPDGAVATCVNCA